MEGFWQTFVFGVLVGFFANWFFVWIMRLVPATLVRYPVEIIRLSKMETAGMEDWKISVKILLPHWLRLFLKEPLREYLHVQLRLDEGEWVQAKWIEGDLTVYRLLADGVVTVDALVLTCSQGDRVLLADDEGTLVPEGNHTTCVRVIRARDGQTAAEMRISFAARQGKVLPDAVSWGP